MALSALSARFVQPSSSDASAVAGEMVAVLEDAVSTVGSGSDIILYDIGNYWNHGGVHVSCFDISLQLINFAR